MIDVPAGLAKLCLGVTLGFLFLGVVQAEEKVEVKRGPRFSTLPACASPHPLEVCERAVTADRAEAILRAAPQQALSYGQHDQTIDIVFKTPDTDFVFGEAPYLCCDLQTYLRPVAAGLWGISIEAPKLSAAVLSISIANLTNGASPHLGFRGPDATHPLVRQGGALAPVRRTIDSRHLKEKRDIYEFKGRLCEHSLARCKVLYLADGRQFADFLNNSPSPAARRALHRMVIVGISNPSNDGNFGEKRASELLAHAGDDLEFRAFERFVTEEVIPFVEPTPVPRTARSVGGWSNGGAWALSIILDHDDLFGSALAFSNGVWRPPSGAMVRKDTKVKFGGGTLERSRQKYEIDVRKVAATGASVDELYVEGGHSTSTWNALFWWAISSPAIK